MFADVYVNPNTLKYGFSVLHAHIRFMELVLHITYRMEIKKRIVSEIINKYNIICKF